eukprot:m.37385 g.37385  ORF g.37385 m.37385 type:complete len:168 (+) comp32372_c0_seq2:149-652(+)
MNFTKTNWWQAVSILIVVLLIIQAESRPQKRSSSKLLSLHKRAANENNGRRKKTSFKGKFTDKMKQSSNGVPPNGGESCEIKRYKLTIKRSGCNAKVVFIDSCKGFCRSSHSSDASGAYFSKSCHCCQAIKFGKARTITLNCPRTRLMVQTAVVYDATECSCRRGCS